MSAAIAQLVEHFIRNEKVMGSSPIRGSNRRCVGIAYFYGVNSVLSTLKGSTFMLSLHQ